MPLSFEHSLNLFYSFKVALSEDCGTASNSSQQMVQFFFPFANQGSKSVISQHALLTSFIRVR